MLKAVACDLMLKSCGYIYLHLYSALATVLGSPEAQIATLKDSGSLKMLPLYL